ncbi:hypothetical protein L195_g031227, partial [Trifolium pratense]
EGLHDDEADEGTIVLDGDQEGEHADEAQEVVQNDPAAEAVDDDQQPIQWNKTVTRAMTNLSKKQVLIWIFIIDVLFIHLPGQGMLEHLKNILATAGMLTCLLTDQELMTT